MTTTATSFNRPNRTRYTAPRRRIPHHAFPACLPADLRGPLSTLTNEQLNDYMEIVDLERKGWGHPRAVAAISGMGAVGSTAGEPEDDEDEDDEDSELDTDTDDSELDEDSDTDDYQDEDLPPAPAFGPAAFFNATDDATWAEINEVIAGDPSSAAESITDRDPHHTYRRMHASIGEDIDDSHGGWIDFGLPTTAELMDTAPTKIDLGVLAVIQHDIGGEAGGA